MDASPTAGAGLLANEIRRQDTRRIKSKFLEAVGMPASKIEAFERASKPKGCLSRGRPNRRILLSKLIDGVRYEFHATKGWRSHREA
jgi:hypothetical protein